MCFSSRAAAIRQRSSPKSQVIFAFVFSCIGDFFRIFGINIVQVTASFLFLSLKCMRIPLLQPLQTKKCGSAHYITIGDSRLRTVLGCGTRSPLYVIRDAASRRGLCTAGLEIRVVLWPQSIPKLLQDHQIVLGGGPVVYWKTHHKRTVFKKKVRWPR